MEYGCFETSLKYGKCKFCGICTHFPGEREIRHTSFDVIVRASRTPVYCPKAGRDVIPNDDGCYDYNEISG